MKRSKEVDKAIKRCYALLATHMFKMALSAVDFDSHEKIAPRMNLAEGFLEKAGAQATSWYFRA